MKKGDPLPRGVFPTMITPFTDDREIDYPTLDAMIEWYILSGCTGLFACCQSSEMYHLTPDERIALARHVATKAAGRVAVVASGTFAGTVEEQAAFVNRMAAEVDAVVVLVCQMASKSDSDQDWTANVSRLLELTGDVPLGLYEVPAPYHRLLSPEQIAWCAGTGRFLFHKDTCCHPGQIAAKIAAIPEGSTFRFYNANAATVQFSMRKGGAGFSGINANFYPQLVAWLVENSDHPRATALQQYLAVAENVVMYKYPQSAKAFLAQYDSFSAEPGRASGMGLKCRKDADAPVVLNEEEQIKLEALHATSAAWCKELGIARYNPATLQPDDIIPDRLA